MSNIKKLSGAVLLDSPKGYGILRNSKTGTNIGFTNAITIYGKKHLLNSLTSFLKDGGDYSNKLPKLIGLSIMFRRCGSHVNMTTSDPPTKLDHKLTKGFFEHIYGVYGGTPTNVTKTTNKTSLSCFITGGTCGFKLEDITPATDTGGMWGGATLLSGNACLDPDPTQVWHDVNLSLGDAPKKGDAHQCLKDESANPGFGFAKIAGISVLTSELGGYVGGPQLATPAGSNSNAGNTIKVWRDPTFMELIHQQESLRTMGSASYQMPDYDDHTAVSFGHYFPNKDHFDAINTAVQARDTVIPFQLGDSHLIGSCSTTPESTITEATCTGIWTETHNIWEWKHCGIDTFAFTGFATHWYGANAGSGGDNVGSPFANLDLTNRTADNVSYNGRMFDGNGDLQTIPDTDHKWYTPIARQAGNFNNPITNHGYEYDDVTYWAWADHDSLMTKAEVLAGTKTLGGDGLLQDQVQNAEIEYDKLNSQAPADQENFIDYNDTITTQYTLNFAQTSAYETSLDANIDTSQNNSTIGDLDTTIESANLAEKWAKDFGQDGAVIDTATPYGWGTATNSAIRGIRLFDRSGRIMMAKTTGDTDQVLGFVTDDEIANDGVSNYNNVTNASFSVFTLTKDGDESKSVHVKDVTQIDNSHINDPVGTGSDYIIDNTSKRPRILVNTIRLFFNQLHVDDTNSISKKPHKLEVYAMGASQGSNIIADDLIFTFILGSSEWEDNIAGDLANPFTTLANPDTTADGDILSMATADWTSGNHLDVTLKFVMV